MTDMLTKSDRSALMARIRGKDTKPELVVRRFLHQNGFRFRLQRRDLPGRPDIVLPKLRSVIFVHGCFWHRHAGCFRTTTPTTRRDFWEHKFKQNIERDLRNVAELSVQGWKTLTIWECEVTEIGLTLLASRLNMQTKIPRKAVWGSQAAFSETRSGRRQ